MDVAGQTALKIVGEDSRRAVRTRVLLRAALRTSGRDYPVRLRDVSATGVRVEADELPRRLTDVVVERGAFSAFGQVVWVGGRVAGIEFDEPLDPNDMFETLNALRQPADEAPFRRPGFDRLAEDRLWSDGRGWVDPGCWRR